MVARIVGKVCYSSAIGTTATQSATKKEAVMFEKRYRHAEGSDQLDLFASQEKRSSVLSRAVPFLTIATIALAFSFLPRCARAEEAKLVYVTSALLCDSEDLLKAQVDFIANAEKTGGSATGSEVEGCALVVEPGSAIVTPIGVYANDVIEVIIASFTFGTQEPKYGYIASRPVTGAWKQQGSPHIGGFSIILLTLLV